MNTRTSLLLPTGSLSLAVSMPLLVVVSMLAVAGPVEATTVEQAQADTIPWSGWWWPLRQGGIFEPSGFQAKFPSLPGLSES